MSTPALPHKLKPACPEFDRSRLELPPLCVIVDFNKWRATGRSCEVSGIEPLAAKWEAFGFTVREGDGHDFHFLIPALAEPSPRGKEMMPETLCMAVWRRFLSRWPFLPLTAALLPGLILAGCSLGPKQLKGNRIGYNVSIQRRKN